MAKAQMDTEMIRHRERNRIVSTSKKIVRNYSYLQNAWARRFFSFFMCVPLITINNAFSKVREQWRNFYQLRHSPYGSQYDF